MGGLRSSGRKGHVGAADARRVVDAQAEVGHRHRVRRRADAPGRVGHVAAVVGAVHPLAVPTVGEVDPHDQVQGRGAVGRGHDLGGVLTAADARPPDHVGGGVGDDSQSEREGLDRRRVAARHQVVGEDVGRLHDLARVRQGRHPVGGLVAVAAAQVGRRLEGLGRREGVGRRVAEEVVAVGRPRRRRMDDGVVRRGVGVAADADEIACRLANGAGSGDGGGRGGEGDVPATRTVAMRMRVGLMPAMVGTACEEPVRRR